MIVRVVAHSIKWRRDIDGVVCIVVVWEMSSGMAQMLYKLGSRLLIGWAGQVGRCCKVESIFVLERRRRFPAMGRHRRSRWWRWRKR